jgi:flagellar biosynthesis/type III secretory pathway M-ring protein FliF/YscJ
VGANVNPPRNLTCGMSIALAALVLAFVVAFVVVAPLRRGPSVDRREDERRAALEAAKEAKYREIRDAELDFQMGKLTEADYRLTDRELRGQAIGILRELDTVTPVDSAGGR